MLWCVTRVALVREPGSARLRERMRTPLLLDGRDLFDPDVVRAAGFTYVGVGRAQADTPPRLRIAAASVG